jgi:hypothetical protein
MSQFPELGLASYGVLSGDLGGLELATGRAFTDDEDDGNADKMSCGSFCSDAATFVSGAHDTAFSLAQVKACEGASNGFVGCRGTGCAVCTEKVPRNSVYWRNHPNCAPNDTCGGTFYSCNANCPAPTAADLVVNSCGGWAEGWKGCRGSGCAVCKELIANYPRYLVNHPNCTLNSACGGSYYNCNYACPAPTIDDI